MTVGLSAGPEYRRRVSTKCYYNADGMTTHDLTWCCFCQDRPAIGRMVVMRDKSREQVSEITGPEGAACDLHGRSWTGVPVATDTDTKEFAVLQYVHPEFSQVTEEDMANFAQEKICAECGDPTDPLPLWVAERILRAHPKLVLESEWRWDGICGDCAERIACPDCNDGLDEDSGAYGCSTHPYFH